MANSNDIQSTMSTKIQVDTQQAGEEVANLTNKVKDLTSSWKAEEAMAKASGDAIGAAKARYQGLSETLEVQKQKVEQLKRERQDMQQTIRESATVTKEQTDDLNKLDRQLASASNKLNSLSNQQERAKRSFEYASSGLKELKNEYYNNSRAIDSNVEKLRAEGQTAEAQKAKLSGLRISLENLTKQQKAAKELADSVARDEGKNSIAYQRRITDYNKISAAIAKTKTEAEQLSKSLNPPHTTAWDAFKNKIFDVNGAEERAAKAGQRFKSVFSGAFLGTLTANILPAMQNQLHQITTTGMQAAQAGMAMETRWKNIGVAAGSVKQLSAQVNDLRTNTYLSAQSVNALQTRFYGMTHSVKQTKQLTQSVGSLSDKLKLSERQSNAFASGLSRIESSGKVSSATLGRLEKQAPGLTAALQKASGMSKQAFNDLLSSGKMTADQFNQLMVKASGDYKKNAAGFSQTSGGAMHKLRAEWAITQGKLAKPLVKVEATGLNQLSTALNNKDTQRGLQTLATGMATLAVNAAKALAVIARHQTAVKALTVAFGGLFISIKALNAFNFTVLTFRTFTKIVNGSSLAARAFGVALRFMTGPIGIAITAVAALAAIFVHLYKHNAKFRSFVNGIGKQLKNMGKSFVNAGRGILKSADNLHKKLSKSWSNYWRQRQKEQQQAQKREDSYWASVRKSATRGWNNFVRSAQSGAKRVNSAYQSMNSWTSKQLSNMARNHPRTFGNMYRLIQDHTRVWHDVVSGHWSNLGRDTGRLASDASRTNRSIFKSMYDDINNKTDGGLGRVVSSWQSHMSSIGDAIKSAAKHAAQAMADLANLVLKPFKTLIDDIQGGINWVLDKIGASKLGGSWSAAIPTFATGTAGNRDGLKKATIGMVNDGAGSHWRELYSYKGQVGAFPNKRNFITFLPKGMSILNGEDSHKLMSAIGLPKFANGIGDFFSGLKDDAEDWMDNADKIMAHPIEFMEHVFTKKLSGLSSGIKFAQSLITNVPIYIAKQMAKWVKEQFETLDSAMNPNGTSAAPTGDHKHWMKQAGIPASWYDSINYIVSHESGWRVNATNPSSGAYGLPQSLPGSKMAAAGRDWRTNPITQLKWMKSYVSRYGGGPGAAAFWRSHHWYADGGKVDREQLIHVAEHNSPEMIIPLTASKRGRAYQLLSEVMAQFKHEDGPTQPTRDDQSISRKEFMSLESKLDQLISGVQLLVQVGQQQIDATINSGNKLGLKSTRSTLYNAMGKDQRVGNYMSYRR